MAISTSDKLIEELRTHSLLSGSQLGELEALPDRPADPRELVKEIVKRDWLTRFQANVIYQGRSKDLVLGPYVLLDKLGEGGMGEVYRARHRRLERVVALKLIRTERAHKKDVISRFQREARAAAQLSHPNIVTLFDDGQEGEVHFFAMEYVRGVDLSKWVREKGPMPVAHACNFIRQAAQGLQHAHEKGMVHRDIKPSNLMLVAGANQVKVLDMGLARIDRADTDERSDTGSITHEGVVMGTPDFLAPEQAIDAHKADIRADIYSLGCSLYYLLTGQVPFPGGTLSEKLLKHQLQEPKPVREIRPEVPESLAAVLARLIAKKPEARPQTPGDVAALLAPFCKAGPTAPAGQPVRLPAPTKQSNVDTDVEKPMPTVSAGEGIDVELVTDVKAPAPTKMPAGGTTQRPRPKSPTVMAKRGGLAWIGWAAGAAAGVGAVILAIVLAVVFMNFLGGHHEDSTPAPKPGPAPEKLATLDDLKADIIPAAEQFGWHPRELVAVFGTHKWRHWAPVRGLAFSKDGAELASFGDDEVVRLCNVKTGAERLSILTTSPTPAQQVRTVLYSPDGTFLATLVSNQVTVYLASTGREETVKSLPGIAIAFSPDSKTLAVANGAGVDLYAAPRWTPLGTLRHASVVTALGYKPNSNVLATFTIAHDTAKPKKSVPPEIKLWDLGGEKLPTQPKDAFAVDVHGTRTLHFSPDGHLLVTAATTGVQGKWPIFLWDVAAKKEKARLEGHTYSIWATALTADNQTLVSAGLDGTVRLWSLQNYRERVLPLQDHGGPVEGLAVSPDGKALATGGRDGAIRLYDLPSGKEREESTRAYESWIRAGALSHDRTLLATAHNDKTVRLWEAAKLKERAPLKGHSQPVQALTFSTNDQYLFSAGLDKSVGVWDVAKNAELPPFIGYANGVYAVAFAPEGQQLATGSQAPFIKLLDPASHKELATLPGHTALVVSLDYFSEGKNLRLVSASKDGSVRAWDAVKGKELFAMPGAHVGGANAVAVAPKGKTLLASGGEDGGVKVWDALLSRGIQGYRDHIGAAMLNLSPQGPLAVPPYRYTRGPDPTLVKTWKNELMFGNYPAPYRAVAFSPDGKLLAAGCLRGGLSVYDTTTWSKVHYWKLTGGIQQLAFDSAGRHLMSVNNNGTVYLFRPALK